MKIEDQVITIAQGKQLQELGITAVAHFAHVLICPDPIGNDWYYDIIDRHHPMADKCEMICMAYTVAELGMMLPKEIDHTFNEHSSYYIMMGNSETDNGHKPTIWYEDNDLYPPDEIMEMRYISGDTEAEARAAMLIHLLENKLITADEINARL